VSLLVRSAVAAGCLAISVAALAGGASARVPQGFAGAMVDGPMMAPGYDPGPEMDVMVASGVESVRVAFHWVDGQPYRSFADVPAAQLPRFTNVGGVPTDFTRFDPVVGAAARRGIELLAVPTTSPWWAAKYPGTFGSPPRGTATFARYVRALVARYGPRGSFWRENPQLPRRPVRRWQLWNEPSLRYSWTDARWAPAYVRLLRAGGRAIRRLDRRARIVLAGLPNDSWRALRAIYRQRGARRLFDETAVHPYTRPARGLAIIVARARAVMRRNGDARKPISVTEYGWPSSRGKVDDIGVSTTEQGQARRLGDALPLLASLRRRLGISRTYYYSWLGPDRPSTSIFYFAGLRRIEPSGEVVPKPAWRVFRRAALRLERCRRKAAVATRCVKRVRAPRSRRR